MTMLLPLAVSILLNASCPASIFDSGNQPNSTVSSTFNATVWGGEQIHVKSTLAIGAPTADVIPVALTDADTNKTLQIAAQRGVCGKLNNDQYAQQLNGYNNAIDLLSNAPVQIKPNVAWKSTVALFVSQKQRMDVPVSVKVVKVDANGILLQAVGESTGVLSDYGTPFDMTYQAAALYRGGMLVRADSEAQEAVQAGPQSQTMKFAWSIMRKS